jgi:hypothetical protein
MRLTLAAETTLSPIGSCSHMGSGSGETAAQSATPYESAASYAVPNSGMGLQLTLWMSSTGDCFPR